ncbi:MAG: hypothetical protein KGI66_04565 [Patescibacteria group bacterium]|nr:hypothetical protein [Patescibacteria group bacterium]
MNVRSTMEYVGFHPREIQLYISALESGDSTTAELSDRTDIPLTTAEEVLRRMHKHGLVNSYTRRHRLHWVAVDPEKIAAGLAEKLKAFEGIVPKLRTKQTAEAAAPRIITYTGAGEIKLILDDMIETKHEISAFLPWDNWIDFLGEDYVSDLIERRRKRFLRMRLVTDKTPASAKLRSADPKELRLTRFLPQGSCIENANFIYADKTAMISMNEKRPFGILIKDQAIAGTMKLLFESMWQTSV